MTNREFLQLARDYEPHSMLNLGNWFVSEKLDGMRAWWDGGISRGQWCDSIPWANTEKDDRLLVRPRATGLWSRYGKVIVAPSWWLDGLPPFPLDGELYAGRGKFQQLISTVKRLSPIDTEWRSVRYHVFDSPAWSLVLGNGRINVPNFSKVFSNIPIPSIDHLILSFEKMLGWLEKNLRPSPSVVLHPQAQLGWRAGEAEVQMQEMLETVTAGGGEGLMLRHPSRIWEPRRVSWLLKVKKLHCDEGVVVGYTWGRETDRGSKLAGMMGALILTWHGKRFELSGFTDVERVLVDCNGNNAARFWQPGFPVDLTLAMSTVFPIGSIVRFMYRELTRDGIPKEARYAR